LEREKKHSIAAEAVGSWIEKKTQRVLGLVVIRIYEYQTLKKNLRIWW